MPATIHWYSPRRAAASSAWYTTSSRRSYAGSPSRSISRTSKPRARDSAASPCATPLGPEKRCMPTPSGASCAGLGKGTDGALSPATKPPAPAQGGSTRPAATFTGSTSCPTSSSCALWGAVKLEVRRGRPGSSARVVVPCCTMLKGRKGTCLHSSYHPISVRRASSFCTLS